MSSNYENMKRIGKEMKIISIILSRGYSEGIFRKNTKKLSEKSFIGYPKSFKKVEVEEKIMSLYTLLIDSNINYITNTIFNVFREFKND